MAGNQHDSAGQRLDSWKQIGAFLGRDERTAKRWEKERGLPVHRVPGPGRSSVFAYAEELTRWLHGNDALPSAAPEPATAQAPSPAQSARPLRAARVLAIALAACIALALAWRTVRVAPVRAHAPNAEAEDLYLKGIYFWHERTPDSLNRAVDMFTQAIVRDPGYAEAYVGLANSYNLLREYSAMPSEQAFPRAIAAARRAIALDDSLSAAHSALAFGEFYWDWNPQAAEREFRRAIQLDQHSVPAHHWFATSLLTLGRFRQALAEIELARKLDPASTAIVADRAYILFFVGRTTESVTLLKQLESTEPAFLSPHYYLSYIDLTQGDVPGYLAESRAAAVLLHDRPREAIIDAAAEGYGHGGRTGFLTAMLAAQRRAFAAGQESAFNLAETCALAGDGRAALEYLRASRARHEAAFVGIGNNRLFAALQSQPEFQAMLRGLGERPE